MLTPLAFDSAHPFPFISNLSLNLAIIIRDPKGKELFARIKIPDLFLRFIRVPDSRRGGHRDNKQVHLVYLQNLVAANLDLLFPGLEVVGASPFVSPGCRP